MTKVLKELVVHAEAHLKIEIIKLETINLIILKNLMMEP